MLRRSLLAALMALFAKPPQLRAAATARAYALPISLSLAGAGDPAKFEIRYECIVGDNIKDAVRFATAFAYDAAQTQAANLTRFKSEVVSRAADLGYTVAATNIIIFIGIV